MIDLIRDHPEEARALLQQFSSFSDGISCNLGNGVLVNTFITYQQSEETPDEKQLLKSNQELVAECMKYYNDVGYKREYRVSVKQTIKMLITHTRKHPLEITVEDLVAFFDYLKTRKGRWGTTIMPETIRRHIYKISSFFNFLTDRGYLRENPCPPFKRMYLKPYLRHHRCHNRRQSPTTKQMMHLIRPCLDPQNKAILLMLAKTGLRACELLSLNYRDIDFDNRCVRVRVRENEHHKRDNAILPTSEDVSASLKRWMSIRAFREGDETHALFLNERGKRMRHSTLNKIVKRCGERIGIHKEISKHLDERFTSHCLRHWFTTTLEDAGVHGDVVDELRGDDRKGKNSRSHYRRIPLQKLRDAIERLPKLGV